jgi:hypothetical protein
MSGFLGIILRFVALVPSIIILIGCCIIFRKMRNEGAVLMLIGKTLGLLVSIFILTTSLIPVSWKIGNNLLGMILMSLPFVGIPASFLFAFGFIRFARTIEAEE